MTMSDAREDWPPSKIREAIWAKGISQAALALQNGLPESAVRGAIFRSRPSAERVIAEFLGVPAHEIWPSRYFPDGRRKARPLTPRDPIAAARMRHGQKGVRG